VGRVLLSLSTAYASRNRRGRHAVRTIHPTVSPRCPFRVCGNATAQDNDLLQAATPICGRTSTGWRATAARNAYVIDRYVPVWAWSVLGSRTTPFCRHTYERVHTEARCYASLRYRVAIKSFLVVARVVSSSSSSSSASQLPRSFVRVHFRRLRWQSPRTCRVGGFCCDDVCDERDERSFVFATATRWSEKTYRQFSFLFVLLSPGRSLVNTDPTASNTKLTAITWRVCAITPVTMTTVRAPNEKSP